MRSLTIWTWVIFTAVNVGCATFERVEEPVDLRVEQEDSVVTLEPPFGRASTVSIGGELVRFEKTETHLECCRVFLRRRLPISGWRMTHRHNGAPVYTNGRYFSEQIGIILDEDLNIVRWIQLGGMKRGRSRTADTPLFKFVRVYLERWYLRYGGRSGEAYRFELVERPGDNQSEVIQPIEISEELFLEGFYVRGIGIQGLRHDHRGTIDFRTFE